MTNNVEFYQGLVVEVPEEQVKPGTEIYVAGPAGFMESMLGYHLKLMELLRLMGVTVLNPWELTDFSYLQRAIELPAGQDKIDEWAKANRILTKNNNDALRRADGIVALLDGLDIDSGTSAEIAWFHATHGGQRPTLGIRSDFRQAGDNEGSRINIQVEEYIFNSMNTQGEKGTIIRSTRELPQQILRLWGARNRS